MRTNNYEERGTKLTFKNEILGIINSSKTGPEKVGLVCTNPLTVNFDETVLHLKEMRGFMNLDTFNRILIKIQQRLEDNGRADISEKLKEKLNG